VESFLLAAGVIAAMVAIIPLMVWGGSGDWRYALTALWEYVQIMGGMVLIVGGLAVVVSIAEHGWSVLRIFTAR
jgi:hypothetical protein